MTEPVVCIFPHSDKEFPTSEALRGFLSHSLPQPPEEGRYLFGKIGRKDKNFKDKVIPGSLVLFRKKGFIVGQAISKTMIEELEPPEEGETETGAKAIYYHKIFFVPESIEVYPKALPIEQVESWANRKLDPRYYSIIGTKQAYEHQFGK